MAAGLLLGVALLAALACPVLMVLGRRGIGPGCALMGCTPRRKQNTIESVRREQQQLAQRLAAYEARQAPAQSSRDASSARA